MATVILKAQQEERILRGHPWIFNTQIQKIQGECKPADIVDILSARKEFLGKGYINSDSNIVVRVLTRQGEAIDAGFFSRRIQQAIKLRKNIIPKNTTAYRVIFSESDSLPGLIADAYGDYLVIQTLTLGIEKRRDLLVDILKEFLRPKGIYLRNDVPVRRREGLALEKKILSGKFSPKQEVLENGIKFIADLENGQKTGLYIDQRDNRQILSAIAKDKKVLDCFCYNGGFSVYCACAGASKTIGIDISASALESAKINMRLNRINAHKFEFKQANAFDELKRYHQEKEKFDIIILDPPSFARSKDKVEDALRGYREINLRAMGILNDGGILVSAACSYHISDTIFKEVIQEAARDAKKTLRVLKWGTQSQDHPIILNINETSYLKCLIAQVF